VSREYDSFNEAYGYPERTTYFLDEDGVISGVTRSEDWTKLGTFEAYRSALT
jgi:hypothetical protein